MHISFDSVKVKLEKSTVGLNIAEDTTSPELDKIGKNVRLLQSLDELNVRLASLVALETGVRHKHRDVNSANKSSCWLDIRAHRTVISCLKDIVNALFTVEGPIACRTRLEALY